MVYFYKYYVTHNTFPAYLPCSYMYSVLNCLCQTLLVSSFVTDLEPESYLTLKNTTFYAVLTFLLPHAAPTSFSPVETEPKAEKKK